MMEVVAATEKVIEIIEVYTRKAEKRLERLGTCLPLMVIPLLLIIVVQLGA